jgi:hypothetical protein
MPETRTLDVTGIPDVFLEALDHLVYMLRMNVGTNGEPPPATVNGVPFAEWREAFYRWMREYTGGPLIDDSRYTIYDGNPPLT